MTKIQIERLKAKLKAEYQRKLDAIELVEKMLNDENEQTRQDRSPTLALFSPAAPATAVRDGAPGTLVDMVLRLLKGRTEPWKAREIEQAVRADGFEFVSKNPTKSIHTALSYLISKNQVRRIREGKGRISSLYTAINVQAEEGSGRAPARPEVLNGVIEHATTD